MTISRRRLIPSGSGRQVLWKIRTQDMLYGGVVLPLTWLLLVWTRLRQVVTLPTPASSDESSSSSFTLSLVPWRQDLKHAPGVQYALSFRRPNGQWKNPIKRFHRIAVQDLHDLPLHSLHEYIHNNNNNQDDDLSQKDYILDLLAATGITEIERPVVQALPTWKRFAEQYGNDEAPIVVGTEACPTLLMRNNNNNKNKNNTNTNHPTAMYVGVAGMFNTGTTTLDLYLRENLVLPTPTWFDDDQQQQQHKAFNQGVPWGKHRLWSLRHDFMPLSTTTTTTTNGANQNAIVDQVFPIVIIRDPFTWMQSMCSSPYKAAWPHDVTIHCPNLVASHEDVAMAMGSTNKHNHHHNVTTVGQFIPTVLTAQKQRKFETLLDLWIEWYTEYLTSNKPRLLVRFEDLLIRPDAVVKEIQSCLQLPSKQQRQEQQRQRDDNDNKFVYVVGAMKWDQKYVKKQSSMVSAIIKYGHGWDRFRNMTAADLEVARQKLSTGPGRTLSQLFHYHYTDVWPEDKDAS